jgi:hypothetical protein
MPSDVCHQATTQSMVDANFCVLRSSRMSRSNSHGPRLIINWLTERRQLVNASRYCRSRGARLDEAACLPDSVVLRERHTRVAMNQSHCRSMQGSLIDAAQHHGGDTAMLGFLGRFLPKLGGVRFGGRRSFSSKVPVCYAALRRSASLILRPKGTLSQSRLCPIQGDSGPLTTT